MKYYHIPLEHILMLALIPSVAFEGKRSITLETFIEFRKTLLKKANSWFNDSLTQEELENYTGIKSKLNFESEIDLEELKKLAKEKSSIYSFDGTTISISEDVTLEQMEDIRCQEHDDDYDFIINNIDTKGYHDKECIDVLKLTKFNELVAEIIKFEKFVEGFYTSGLMNSKTKKQIYAFQMTRLGLLKKLSRFFDDEERTKSFLNYVRTARAEMPPLFSNISELQQHGEEGFCQDLEYVNARLFKRDSFFTALFTDLPLSYYQLHSVLSKYLDIIGFMSYEPIDDISDIFEPAEGWDKYLNELANRIEEQEIGSSYDDDYEESTEENVDDNEEERKIVFAQDLDGNMVCLGASKEESEALNNGFLLFIMQYIAFIDICFKENEFEELEIAKRRLCYVVSQDADFSSYEGRQEFLGNIKGLSFQLIEKNYGNVGYYFIYDIFLSANPKDVLKKLIFIKTAYQLFPDNEYKEAFDEFKKHPKFDEYYEFVFEEDREKPQKRERNH